MSGRVMQHLTVATAIGCGISGGVFFAFSTFVMPALKQLPAPQGISAMQSLNVKAPNAPFMLALFGSAAGCVAVAIAAGKDLPDRAALYKLIAAGVYLVAIVLTISYHVPRNDALNKLDPNAIDSARAWARFVTDWTNANHVRTLTSIAASTLLTLAARAR